MRLFVIIAIEATDSIVINPANGALVYRELNTDQIQRRFEFGTENRSRYRNYIRDLRWDTVIDPEIHSFVVRNDIPDGSIVFEKSTPAGLTIRDIAEGIASVKEDNDEYFYGFFEASVLDGHATYVVKLDGPYPQSPTG